MNSGYQDSPPKQIDLLSLPIGSAWFKKFVESYRCRICEVDLTLDNFGGAGDNHMIFCKDCGKSWEFNTDTQMMEKI